MAFSTNVTNRYKVNKKQWNKWTFLQKEHYNTLRSYSQKIIDPKAHVTKDGFDIISHNFAFLSASNLDYEISSYFKFK